MPFSSKTTRDHSPWPIASFFQSKSIHGALRHFSDCRSRSHCVHKWQVCVGWYLCLAAHGKKQVQKNYLDQSYLSGNCSRCLWLWAKEVLGDEKSIEFLISLISIPPLPIKTSYGHDRKLHMHAMTLMNISITIYKPLQWRNPRHSGTRCSKSRALWSV